ncbi:hypothetical protein GCM10028805_47420 [Spirosoma harenae]
MAKQDTKVSPAEAVKKPAYEIIGLQRQDHMPIEFEGNQYDLANLSDEQAAFLLQYPDKIPFLKATDSTSAPAIVTE